MYIYIYIYTHTYTDAGQGKQNITISHLENVIMFSACQSLFYFPINTFERNIIRIDRPQYPCHKISRHTCHIKRIIRHTVICRYVPSVVARDDATRIYSLSYRLIPGPCTQAHETIPHLFVQNIKIHFNIILPLTHMSIR